MPSLAAEGAQMFKYRRKFGDSDSDTSSRAVFLERETALPVSSCAVGSQLKRTRLNQNVCLPNLRQHMPGYVHVTRVFTLPVGL